MKKILLLIAVLISFLSNAQTSISDVIAQKSNAILPKVIEWRRHIHQNPELGNREFKTAEYIANYLKSLGLEVKTGVGKTGVVAILTGGKPGPCIGLRADMDGLPVAERADIPFKSSVKSDYNGQQVSVMHACGHDTHISMLMGAAQVLSSMKKDIAGTVKFVFQPAEEGPPANEEGGAPLMIKEGVMENPKIDAMFGIHISSELEIGDIRYKSGSFMASSDWFQIKIKGKQTHGSTPWTGIDPIVVGTQIINGLQTIVSRQEDLTIAPVVITVGQFNAGVRANIIPEEATMIGTIRTLDATTQKDVHERIRKVANSIANAWGATVDVSIDTKTLVTYNNPELVKKMLPSLEKAAGKDHVIAGTWTTGAEDFSFFGENIPAFFFNVGGKPKGLDASKAFPHHTPDFYIDDSRLDVGVKAFCNIVMDYKK
jgi:amidohydrolase